MIEPFSKEPLKSFLLSINFEYLPFPTAILSSKDHCIIYGNSHFEKLLQVSSEDFIKKNISDFLNEPLKIEEPNLQLREVTHAKHLKKTKKIEKTARALIKISTGSQKENQSITVFFFEIKHSNILSFHLLEETLGDICHELARPLNGILGMLSLLLETRLTSEQRYYTEIIQKTGFTLLNMIDNILMLKDHQKKTFHYKSRISLKNIIHQLYEIFRWEIQAKKLHFNYKEETSIPDLNCDRDKIFQILMNLISNAVKFTQKGSIEITASLKSKDLLYFSVIDTGIGIPKEMQSQIFERFYKTDENSSGLGVGLTIAQELVKLLGGKVGVESPIHTKHTEKEQAGTKIWFTIKI